MADGDILEKRWRFASTEEPPSVQRYAQNTSKKRFFWTIKNVTKKTRVLDVLFGLILHQSKRNKKKGFLDVHFERILHRF